MNPKFLPALLVAASLSACAQSPLAPATVSPAPADPASVVVNMPAISIPDQAASAGLTSQVLYQVLLGEIASQRGELRLSAEDYSDLAAKTRNAQIAQRAVELAQYAHIPALALADAQIWREVDPNSVKAMQNLVALLLVNGQITEARPHLEAWLKAGKAEEIFPQLHALFSRLQDKEAALGLISGLAAPYPDLPEAHFAVAQVALQAGQMPQALAAIDATLRLRGEWQIAVLARAQVLLRHDGDAAAQAYLSDYLLAHPGAREVRLAYAKQLAHLGRLKEARGEFEKLTLAEPKNPDAHFTLGLIAMQTNDLADARSSFLKAIELGYADDDTARFYLGQLEEADGHFEPALKWYQSVNDGHHQFDAQLRIGAMLARLGRVQEGRDWLAGLKVEDDAGRIQVVQTEAMILRDAQEHKAVFDVLSRGLEKLPDTPELLYDRAMAAEKIDRLDVLEKDLRRLIQLRPDYAQAYNALGYTLADRTDRLPEALELLRQAVKLSPEDPFILDSMGWALFKQKNLPEAIDHLRRAYAAKNDPEIAAHLGEALWTRNEQGDRIEAGRIWQGSLKAYPGNESLRAVLSRLMP